MKIILLCFIFLSFFGKSQVDSLHLGENKLENIGDSFNQFKNKIDSLKRGELTKVRILHIGDSHIQPDNFSGIVRKRFQRKFGNGGRGLVFPYGLAKTNGPKDFFVSSTTSWTNQWIIHYPFKFNVGLPGIGIKSMLDSGSIRLNFVKDTLRSPFTKGFILYSFQHDENGLISVNQTFKKKSNSNAFDTLFFDFKTLQSQLEIQYSGSQLLLHATYFENDKPGVIYNASGVAGARYIDYLRNENFVKQLHLFQPDMLIVSLGTNESFDPTFTVESFRQHVDSMFTIIKNKLPQSTVLITLPSENYRVKNNVLVQNDRIVIISEILRQESVRYGFSIWDLKKAMGGEGSMLTWKKSGLVNKDHIHFLRKGYNLQGELLFEAIDKALINP
jgi:lysophospholipase L1-like esterase